MDKKNEKSPDFYWIDSLRVFATFSVIILHVSAPLLYQFNTISMQNWWIGNIYDSSVRFCVPVFLMISGVLLLSKDYLTINVYLKKRVVRILFPFIFWSFLYLLKEISVIFYMGSKSLNELAHIIFIRLRDGTSYHLWYIYLIIGLYLLFPLLNKWLRNSSKKEIEYFLLIWIITLFIFFPVLKPFVPIVELDYFSGYIGFPILGYYLNRFGWKFKSRNQIIGIILLGILCTAVGTFLLSHNKKVFSDWFYQYLTPNVVLVAIGVFVLFKDFIGCNTKHYIQIKFLSKYSFGVYLVHVLVLWILNILGIDSTFLHPIVGIPITSILCLFFSIIIIFVLNKFPFGKYISGV